MNLSRPLYTAIPALLLALCACKESPAAATASAPATAPASKAAAAVAKNVPAAVAKTITESLQRNYAEQGLKVIAINASPIDGLYETVVDAGGKRITYTDAAGKFMLVGDLIDVSSGESITDQRLAAVNAIDFNALPFDKAIKEVRGNGSLKVAVFSDPDCPYCKRLEAEFAKMDNVTIYTFLMPIPSLHPQAEKRAVQLWCQSDRTRAWTDWMRNGKMPARTAECANPVAETTALGAAHNFTGTPTMVFPNGRVQAGYAPMPHLEVVIKSNQQ